jgi:hypothetical protein
MATHTFNSPSISANSPAANIRRFNRRFKEDLRPTQAPLRYHNGKLQEEYVVTRYDPENSLQRSGQVSQTVEWRDVK